jgi:Protein of unknown function (DUF3047)
MPLPLSLPLRPYLLTITALMALALAGCASSPPVPALASADGWQAMTLPGKTPTTYQWSTKEGRPALMAHADRSASLWRKRFHPARQTVGDVDFSWWVQNLIPTADLNDIDRGDAPARVIFAFDGDIGALPLRTRMMFDVAQVLTGELPPYATLMYVWDARLPVGTVVIHPRSDRVRQIVVDSGPAELHQWRDHRRDLAADFRRAFGEEPGALQSIALMTDSDNTRSQASAWYGPVELR